MRRSMMLGCFVIATIGDAIRAPEDIGGLDILFRLSGVIGSSWVDFGLWFLSVS
jgi:hypothetical protein